jgi:hypothetical protein
MMMMMMTMMVPVCLSAVTECRSADCARNTPSAHLVFAVVDA